MKVSTGFVAAGVNLFSVSHGPGQDEHNASPLITVQCTCRIFYELIHVSELCEMKTFFFKFP